MEEWCDMKGKESERAGGHPLKQHRDFYVKKKQAVNVRFGFEESAKSKES